MEDGRARPSVVDPKVHLWKTRLNTLNGPASDWERCITAAERARAARLISPADRRRWRQGRGALRHVLAFHTGQPPDRIGIVSQDGGKPLLAPRDALGEEGGPWHFNLSHSGDALLIGVARHPLGVDIERVRSFPAPERLARRVLSPRELGELAALPASQRPRALLQAWTAKEAILKARGVGLSIPPKRVEVTIDPAKGPRILALDGQSDRTTDWSLIYLEPWVDYVGTLAVSPPARHIHTHELSELLPGAT